MLSWGAGDQRAHQKAMLRISAWIGRPNIASAVFGKVENAGVFKGTAADKGGRTVVSAAAALQAKKPSWQVRTWWMQMPARKVKGRERVPAW